MTLGLGLAQGKFGVGIRLAEGVETNYPHTFLKYSYWVGFEGSIEINFYGLYKDHVYRLYFALKLKNIYKYTPG